MIDQTKHFTLTSIANEIIAKTSASNKLSTPWFKDDSRIAIRLRWAALRKFNKEPTTNNLDAFKFFQGENKKKTIKEAKKKSWQNYVNQLGSSTRTNTRDVPADFLETYVWH